ncbi:MAG: signal peptidase I [Acidimicrobiales bacterium]
MPNDIADEPVSDAAPADAPDTGFEKPRRKHSGRRAFIEWGLIVILAVLVSLFMRTFVLQTYFIPSASMEPTLQVGDRIMVSKLSLDFGSIHRGDILVFKAPPAEDCGTPVPDLVKRVIGLPGDHLTSKGNTIYVNGKPLKITWTHYEPLGKAIGNVVVPKNRYFMMGDNYPDSCDSRYWGTVPRSDIVGRAFFRIWPLSRIGFL